MNEAGHSRAAPWLTTTLAVWSAGVLTWEPVATLGMIATALAVVARRDAVSVPSLRAFARDFWPVGLFVGWALVAPALGGHPPSGTGVARTVDWLAVPIAAVAWARLDRRGRGAVLGAAGAVFVLSCGLAGLQHVGWWPPLEAFEPLRFTRIPFERVYEPVPGAEARYMGGGLPFHRLKFAHVGGFAALALLVAGLRLRGRARALCLSAAVAGVASIAVFPYARAASAALLLAAVVGAILSRPRRRVVFAVGALAAGSLLLASSIAPLRDRFASSVTAQGSGDRHLLLSAGIAVVQTHLWTGLGPGRFRAMDHVGPDAPEHVRTHPGKAHNQFLSMAAETGVPGALIFCGMLIALARRMNLASASGTFGMSALVFFAALSLVHDPLFHAPFSMAVVLALGIGCAREEQVQP